jgi:CubicO group peptidase (beta-lactamase class C family)
MKLMEQGRLTMNEKVFGTGGILQNQSPFSAANITDNRIYNITVQNLLEHSAGWNRDLNCNPNPTLPYPYYLSGCDPISFPLRVTMLEGTTNPVQKNDLIKYLLEKGLDFAPGTAYNYSNIGYLVLGDIVEKITGLPYEKYVTDSVLAPLGIFDMHLGKNLLVNKQEREGEYTGNGYTTLSCYGNGTYVPWEYGGFSVEAMDAHGGWIASSRDMLKLLTAVDGFATKPDILSPATIAVMTTPSANNANYAKGWQVNGANNWWHTGSLDGTVSEQVRAANGYSWIIICNKRNITSANFGTDLDNLGWNCIAATATWPTWDLMASPTVNAKNITFTNSTSNSVTVNWANGNGDNRILLVKPDDKIDAFPGDGIDYTGSPSLGGGSTLGTNNYVAYNGTGNSVTVTGLVPNKTYYFRLVEYNKNSITGNKALYLLGSNPLDSFNTARALPVTITDFSAHKINNSNAEIKWQTQQELNSSYFEIERSTDGALFTAIGKVQAKGNSSITSAYSFVDKTPEIGQNYYRLKATDKDGKFLRSNSVRLDFSFTGSNFKIVTYAGKQYFSVIKNSGTDFNKAMMLVTNATGQVVIRQSLVNANTQMISSPALVGGLYFVTISSSNNTQTKKMVIH